MKKPTKAEIEKLAKKIADDEWSQLLSWYKSQMLRIAEYVLTNFTRKVKRK